MASVRFESAGYAGYQLAAADGRLHVGAPVYGDQLDPLPQVHSLALPDLDLEGSWQGTWYDGTGTSLDVADIDADGQSEVAIASPNADAPGEGARVHVVPSRVAGDVAIDGAALLTLEGVEDVWFGVGVTFARSGKELWIQGKWRNPDDGQVLAFSTALRGHEGVDQAHAAVTSPDLLGSVAAWDGNRDGEDDLVVQTLAGPVYFEGPWQDARIEDHQAAWLDPCEPCALGQVVEAIGDVTGDGAPDLAFAAPTHETPAHRAGRAYIVESADQPGPADAIPRQIHGAEVGDGMGGALASADVDGDGQHDLVTSASGVYPSDRTGVLLVYRGPIPPGTLTEADADARIYGEYGYDLFVRAIAPVDVDGDGQADLAVGAPGHPAGQARGAVYLLTGATLFP